MVPTTQASKRFVLVQEAWETLRDEDLRREYDCRLDLQARNVVVSDEVGKSILAVRLGRSARLKPTLNFRSKFLAGRSRCRPFSRSSH